MNTVHTKEPVEVPVSKTREKPKPSADVRCLDDVNAKPIEWFWPNRIPAKGTLIAGDGGQGKSQLTLSLVATVTTGGRFCDDTPCEIGSAVLICCEDDAGDTIRPRLDAAGANAKRVHIIDSIRNERGDKESWHLMNGIPVLAETCRKIGDVRLIVIDPISAYMGGSDSHKTGDVRQALAPLMSLADEIGAAVIMVSHLNKSVGNDAMTRVTGSGAFVAAVRAAFLIGPHPDIDDAYCMATLKTNISPDKSAVGYRVVSATTSGGIETSRVEWLAGSLDIDADRLLTPRKSEPVLTTV